MNKRASLKALILITVACRTPAANPEALVDVRVEKVAFEVYEKSVRSLRGAAKISNKSNKAISPFLCGTISLQHETAPGSFSSITGPMACLAASGPQIMAIPPHRDTVISFAVPVTLANPPEKGVYRIKLPIVIDGERVSRSIASQTFSVSRVDDVQIPSRGLQSNTR